jgi:hypothetical protein
VEQLQVCRHCSTAPSLETVSTMHSTLHHDVALITKPSHLPHKDIKD